MRPIAFLGLAFGLTSCGLAHHEFQADGPYPVSGLALPHSGHVVLRTRGQFDAFVARYAAPGFGTPPVLRAPASFGDWAVVVVHIEDGACTPSRTTWGGFAPIRGIDADTLVVIVQPRVPEVACDSTPRLTETALVPAHYSAIAFSAMSPNDPYPPDWVTSDLLGGAVHCYWFPVTGDGRLRNRICL